MVTNKSRRIRVIHLIGHLGLGGSERQLFLMLTNMSKEDFECHVVVFNPSNNYVFDQELDREGITVWHIPPECRSIGQRIWYLFRLFLQLAPDIVHSWSVHDNPYAGVVGLLAGIPGRFGSLRNSLQFENMKRLPIVYRYLALHSVSRLVVNAHATAQELLDAGYPQERVIFLPNCVDTDLFNPERAPAELSEFGINQHHRLVGMVANLRRVKNHQMFVEGMATVIRRDPTVRAVIVGQPITVEPDFPDQIKAIVEKLGLQNQIIFTDFQRDVPEFMRRMDLICLTSVSEGMPNVLLEAMAVGKPIVATRVGGIPELVEHDFNGLLVDSDDVEGFTSAVECILKDLDRAKEMGTHSLALVYQKYRCSQVVQSLEQLYRDVVRN